MAGHFILLLLFPGSENSLTQIWKFGITFPFLCYIDILGASLVAQKIENLPATQETQVQSLGREDPLEKGMETHPSALAWRIS